MKGIRRCQRTGLHFDKNMFSKSLVCKDEINRGLTELVAGEGKGSMVGQRADILDCLTPKLSPEPYGCVGIMLTNVCGNTVLYQEVYMSHPYHCMSSPVLKNAHPDPPSLPGPFLLCL